LLLLVSLSDFSSSFLEEKKENLSENKMKIFSHNGSETKTITGYTDVINRLGNGILPIHRYIPLSFVPIRSISKPSMISDN